MTTQRFGIEPIEAASETSASAQVVTAPAAPRPSATPPGALAHPTPSQALERVQAFAGQAVAETAYRLRRLGATGLGGLALLVAAVVLFVANNLPQSSAVAALKAQIVRLAPLGKAPIAVAPDNSLLSGLPQRDDAPTVVEKVLAQAGAAGVVLSRGQYEYVPARDGYAARYRMTFPVHTTYPKLRDFMDRTLVALPAVAIDGVRIERKKVGDDEVDAELKFSAFVRSEP